MIFYLAVIASGADLSVHVLLVQRGRDAEAVAHAERLHLPLRPADLHGAVEDNVPQVELQTRNTSVGS